MRTAAASLGIFVPGRFTLPPQPAGIGLIPVDQSRSVVPARSIHRPSAYGARRRFGVSEFVPAVFTIPPQPAGIGDMVPTGTMYPIPQNTVLQDAAAIHYGVSGLRCGGECGCGGTCGMGTISTDMQNLWNDLTAGNWSQAGTDFMNLMGESVFTIGTFNVPVWMLAGGGLLLWALVFSGGEHSRYSRGRRAYRSARSAYA